MREGRIARSVVDSLSRLNVAKSQVASGVDTGPVKEHVDKLSRPKSPSSTLKKAGLALIVGAPDPITAVPGVALIATSYAIKGREPAKLDDIAAETRRLLRDIQSLSL